MTFEELNLKVINWAYERQILSNGSADMQLVKLEEERQETLQALQEGNYEEVVDGIGDMLVCIITTAALAEVHPTTALATAYEEIKDRTGHLSSEGLFVKDAS